MRSFIDVRSIIYTILSKISKWKCLYLLPKMFSSISEHLFSADSAMLSAHDSLEEENVYKLEIHELRGTNFKVQATR